MVREVDNKDNNLSKVLNMEFKVEEKLQTSSPSAWYFEARTSSTKNQNPASNDKIDKTGCDWENPFRI